MMRLSYVAIPLLALSLAACGGSDQPTKQWELSGFEGPESTLPDTEADVIYVSNTAGSPIVRGGKGFISKISLDGKMIAQKWVEGLHSPKGLELVGDRLYTADMDTLIEIDTANGRITNRYQAPDAKILNDVAADADGNVYVSDWGGNAIWRLSGGQFEKWLESDRLKNPNGLLVESDRLVVAAWGAMNPETFATETPGHLMTVSLSDKTITDLGDATPIGNLDGIEPFDGESYIVTDWVAGKVFQITRNGEAREILSLPQGTADLGFISATRTAIIPLMMDGKVAAYKF